MEAQAEAIATELAERGHRVAVASRWPLQASGERLGRLRTRGDVKILAPKTTGTADRFRPSEYNLRRALRLAQGVLTHGRPLSRTELATDTATLAARNHDVNAILRRKLGTWITADRTAPALIHLIGRNAAPALSAIHKLETPVVFSQLGQFGLPSFRTTSERLFVDVCTADSTGGARALAAVQQQHVLRIPSIGGFTEAVTAVPARVDRLVMVNRLDPVKRVHVAILAIAQFPDMRLEIFGGGPEYARLSQLIRLLDAEGRIVLRGRATATEVCAALDRAHGFILCSESEVTPTALLEAMSRGRPTVTTVVGGTTDLIREGREGLFFDGSPSDLVKTIDRLATTPNLGTRLGSAARARWAAEFTPAAIMDRYEAVYRHAAEYRRVEEGTEALSRRVSHSMGAKPMTELVNAGLTSRTDAMAAGRDKRGLAVATVVPTYNPDRYLEETLRSLERQTVLPAEVIVVDDGSHQPVPLPPTALPLRLMRMPHGGIAAARNAGIAMTTAPLVHVCDHDDLVEPEFYASIVAAYQADPTVDIVHARMGYIDARGTPLAGQFFPTENPCYGPGAEPLKDLMHRNQLGSVASVFRRGAYEDLEGFRDLHFCQDWDFWIRAAVAGHRFGFVPSVLAWHREHPGKQFQEQNMPRIVAEYLEMFRTLRVPRRHEATRARRAAGLRLELGLLTSGERGPLAALRLMLPAFPLMPRTTARALQKVLGGESLWVI